MDSDVVVDDVVIVDVIVVPLDDDDGLGPSELLLSALQYVGYCPFEDSSYLMDASRYAGLSLEKGSLYKDMLDLHGFQLVDKALYICQKFSEYSDRLVVPLQQTDRSTGFRSNKVIRIIAFELQYNLRQDRGGRLQHLNRRVSLEE